MTASENRTDAAGADTLEKPGAAEENEAAQRRDAAGQASPPKEPGEKPAGRFADDPAELKERLLRVLAEQQNFQRRLERERDDAVRFAATQLIKELLQTAGNLSRALQSVAPGAPDQNA